MATFGELWTAILPAALPVAPPDASQLGREVGWVRVLKARVPAFDALDPGDVAIVPGSALAVVAPTAAETVTLVEALAAARCAGILVIEGDATDATVATVDALGRASIAAGLPALRVGRVDPNQLERSVIGFLLNRRAELEHQAGLLEATLEEVALGSGDVGALIAAIGGFLGRAVALEGRRGDLLAVHAPEQAPGAASAVSAYLAGSRTAALRVALPAPPTSDSGPGSGGSAASRSAASGSAVSGSAVSGSSVSASAGSAGSGAPASAVSGAVRAPSHRASSAGRLVLLGERPASDLERVVGPRVGRLLALELARAEAVRRAQDSGRRADVLPADGPPWVMVVARQVPGGGSIEAREEIRSRLRVIASPRRLALRGDAESLELRLVLAVRGAGPRETPSAPNFGTEVLTLAAKVADLLDRPVAVSRPFSDPVGRPAAEAEARATLEAIESLPESPNVARGDWLPAYRLLASMQNLPEGTRHARALLEPILTGSPDARRERLATLRAVLEQPGFNEAAAALGVHRNTLAYRIRRIEQVTGWRLADPDVRLPIAIAVRLVQSEQ